MKKYQLIIKDYENRTVDVIGSGMSEHKAEKVERGILINLDRDNYLTEIKED